MINTLSMEAGLAALTDKEHILKSIQMNTVGKEYIYQQFDRLGIDYWQTEANFILFRPPMPNNLFVPKMMEYGIMIRPTELMGIANCTRVTIGTMEANHTFINALSAVVREALVGQEELLATV